MSLALSAYQCAAWALEPLAGPALRQRARAGKEDPLRLSERLGHAGEARPPGPLLWLHGASVGESRVLLTVQRAMAQERPDLSFLFTSGTRTSAAMLAAHMPPRCRHQFAPVDSPRAVRRFLDHWRPDLGVFAESDLWPNLVLGAASRGLPLALVNARLSPKSLANWARAPASGRRLFQAFSVILTADARTADGLGALLGRAPPALGNLKLCAPPPGVAPEALSQLKAMLGDRPLWLAASTHEGEDEIALSAHAALRAKRPDALLILCPRHPERGEAVSRLARQAFAKAAPRRSLNEPAGAQDAVYVADTMGELGLFYAAAPVALVAGSLLAHLKGHNPAEPLQLGAAALSGPFVESFSEVFQALIVAGAVCVVETAASLAAEVERLWANPGARSAQVASGREALAEAGAALQRTVEALAQLAPRKAE